ncbi:MAG: DUF924 domain-containing protein [Alphaproteobacteria bacterium]|nr:DUF924 domain-containing protein [Alphaproteobacteria bacterium]
MGSAEDILNFWIYEVGQNRWFSSDPALDAEIARRFSGLYEQAVSGQLKAWEETPEGMLGLMLLLDQFPRRMFRGTPRAFAADDMALELARDAIIKHFDDRIDKQYKLLFYLPFLNSESMGDQKLALFYIRERARETDWLSLAENNYEIVHRFGRFPQRNHILGRQPTPDEIAFLERAQAHGLMTVE